MTEFKGQLLDFQVEDVEFLIPQSNVLVASEMGTGKSYIGIALDVARRKGLGEKTLVVAPLSVISSWQNHLRDLTDLRVVTVDTSTKIKRDKTLEEFKSTGADVYIVNWDSLRLMPELQKVKWFHIIADECHRAGNRKSRQTEALKKIKATHKTGMTGTPAEKDNIWSLLNWLYPKKWSSYWRWFHRYVNWIQTKDKDGNDHKYKTIIGLRQENLPELHMQMAPFMVRRLKKDVLKDLPDKYYTEIEIPMEPKQAREYHSMRKNMLAWVGAQEDEMLAAPITVAKLTRLQQQANACMSLAEDGSWKFIEPSNKLKALMDILTSTDQPVVVFTQFATMVRFIERSLDAAGIAYVSLTGAVPQAERGNLVEDFQSGRARVFLATIGAGGEGITLTAASTLVFVDRTYSVRMNQQAEDRSHRIGQRNALQVIDLISTGTVDRGRRTLLSFKKEWIREILGDEG